MNASELVKEIQKITEEHGDLEILVSSGTHEVDVFADAVYPQYVNVEEDWHWDIDEEDLENDEDFQSGIEDGTIQKFIVIAGG